MFPHIMFAFSNVLDILFLFFHLSLTYMWVVLHEDQKLWSPIGCHLLVGGQVAGDVVMLLQQRQSVDGALVGEVWVVSRAENFNSNASLIQRATKHRSITTSTNQLPERRKKRII